MDEPKLTAVSKRELYFIFGALMLGMLLAALDGSIKSATGRWSIGILTCLRTVPALVTTT